MFGFYDFKIFKLKTLYTFLHGNDKTLLCAFIETGG